MKSFSGSPSLPEGIVRAIAIQGGDLMPGAGAAWRADMESAGSVGGWSRLRMETP